MTTKLIFFILIITLTSCVFDPAQPRVEIINQSDKNVQLELHFDTVNYRKTWSKQNFKLFLTSKYGFSYPGPETKLISFDTTHLIHLYLIPPTSTYCISGWGDINRDVLYYKVKVIHNYDTTVYNNINEIKESFLRIDKNINRLEIK